ncbi:hypothetical protein ACOMHN_044098 [Nucella lapillus]
MGHYLSETDETEHVRNRVGHHHYLLQNRRDGTRAKQSGASPLPAAKQTRWNTCETEWGITTTCCKTDEMEHVRNRVGHHHYLLQNRRDGK